MIDAILKRRSVREYLDEPVSDEDILQLLEAARLAPSGNNKQPWHFIVVRSLETRQALAHADHDQTWMLSAPVFFVCLADATTRIQSERDLYIDEQTSRFEVKQVIRDTAIAIDHILLQAAELGLGTCWTGFYRQADVRPILNIPADKFVVGILTVGHPAAQPTSRPRKSLEEITHWERWS